MKTTKKFATVGLVLTIAVSGCGAGSSDPKLNPTNTTLPQKLLAVCNGKRPEWVVPLATKTGSINYTDQLLVACPRDNEIHQLKIG